MLFVETHYTLATEEAERIGVDHVARLSNTGTIDGSTGTCIHDQIANNMLSPMHSTAESSSLQRLLCIWEILNANLSLCTVILVSLIILQLTFPISRHFSWS